MGLTEEEVVESRKKYGTNDISKRKNNTFLQLIVESLGDPIIKILLIALAIKVIVLFRNFDFFETLGILIAIFLATFISSISEYGSEKAFLRLQNEGSRLKVKTKRNGLISELDIGDLVVGDIVFLNSGDMIPADGIIISGSISVDESSLNGEAKEIKKTKDSLVYRSSVIYSGEAIMRVSQVGDKTIIGKISEELQDKIPDSPLKIRLRELAKTISKIGYIGAFLASISYLFSVIILDNNFDISSIIATLSNFPVMINHLIYAFTLSVTIIVVAVPEGLPMMITLVLSSNMKRMMKDKVLVRKMVGIETSGSLNFLLTDKTGTLTKGILKVTDLITGDLKQFKNVENIKQYPIYEEIYKSLFFNNSSIITDKCVIGSNSTDRALMNFIKYDKDIKVEIADKELFDSVKKYSSVTLKDGTIYIKGAKEIILPKCNYYLNSNNRVVAMNNKNIFEKKINSMASNSGRIIVLAKGRSISDLTLVGIVSIKDELRTEAKQGINLIEKAGVNIIMITGDAKETAVSIANEVGLLNNKSIILTSDEFNKMDDFSIKKIIYDIKVIARAMPQDKSRLATIIEDMGLVVGMTGDGVNDAPALKKANVGFAMGSGTEVAKEAADIVILDNNILSISKAILYGRTVFKSIRKFIIYQLTVNMCALILSIIGTLIGITTPITIVQMLWLNMIMDTFAGIAFSFEPPLLEYMDEMPKNKDIKIINKYMYSQIIWSGVYSALLCIIFLKLPMFHNLIRDGENNKYLMTAYFAMFIFMGILNAFNSRTTRINIFANIKKNKVFALTFLFIFIVQIYIIYHGGEIFRTYGLTLKELIIVFVIALTVIPVDWIRKYILKRRKIKIEI